MQKVQWKMGSNNSFWKESKTGRGNKPEEIPAEQVQSLKERPAEYGTGNNQGHCPQK